MLGLFCRVLKLCGYAEKYFRAMLHNPDDYPDPTTFKPERFIGTDGKIDSSVRDPRTIAFGFGRR